MYPELATALRTLKGININATRPWHLNTVPVQCISLTYDKDILSLGTDAAGDGLYIYRDYEDGVSPLAVQIFSTRDFSLHKYDLSTEGGRRKAREYVRRKLGAL